MVPTVNRLVLDGAKLDPGRPLALDSMGDLVMERSGTPRWRAGSGDSFDLDLGPDLPYVHAVCDEHAHRALLATEYGDSVYVLDALSPAHVTVLTRLGRFDMDRGMRHLRLHLLKADDVLVQYETGLAVVHENRLLSWQVEHGRIDWLFERIGDGAVWLIDQDGHNVGFRLVDGQRA